MLILHWKLFPKVNVIYEFSTFLEICLGVKRLLFSIIYVVHDITNILLCSIIFHLVSKWAFNFSQTADGKKETDLYLDEFTHTKIYGKGAK